MAVSETFYTLRKDLPKTWEPEEILLSGLTFEYTNGFAQFILSDAEVYVPEKGADIGRQVARCMSGQLAKATPATRSPDADRWSWLAIPSRRSALVIVRLEGRTQWRFRAGGPAITAKSDPRADTFGPWNFTPDGNSLAAGSEADCMMVAFAVVRRGVHETQSFNFHIELLQRDDGGERKWLEVIIDPDVPETGTNGFPFINPPQLLS